MSDQVAEVRLTSQPSDNKSKASSRGAGTHAFATVLAVFGADFAPVTKRGAGLSNQIRHETANPAMVEIHELASAELQTPKAARSDGSRDARREASSQRSPAPGQASHPALSPAQSRYESQMSKDLPGVSSQATPSSKHEKVAEAETDRGSGFRQSAAAPMNDSKMVASRAPSAVAVPQSSGLTSEARSASLPTTGRALVGVEGLRPERATTTRQPSQSMQRPMLRVDQQQLPSQVARALARVMSTGGGSMTLQLSPQSLGEVRVEISIQRGAATAIFDAENQSARDLLKSEMDHLRSALERRGVVVERLEVRDAGTARVNEAEGTLHGSKHESTENEASSRGRQEWSPPTWNGSLAETNENAGTQVRAEPASGGWTPTLHVEVRAEGTLRLEALA